MTQLAKDNLKIINHSHKFLILSLLILVPSLFFLEFSKLVIFYSTAMGLTLGLMCPYFWKNQAYVANYLLATIGLIICPSLINRFLEDDFHVIQLVILTMTVTFTYWSARKNYLSKYLTSDNWNFAWQSIKF